MINKIIASYIFFACLLALALYFAGVHEPVHLGTHFQAFLVATNRDLIDFKIAIPDIPQLPSGDFVELGSGFQIVINVLTNIGQVLVAFINFITRILNIIINILNVVIQVLEFIILFVKNLIIMRDNIASA